MHFEVCFEASCQEAEINENTKYYIMFAVKAFLCTGLNEEWLINIF